MDTLDPEADGGVAHMSKQSAWPEVLLPVFIPMDWLWVPGQHGWPATQTQ